jgi:ABC-type transport system involved in multi-copper enzyme maturation permease subunit
MTTAATLEPVGVAARPRKRVNQSRVVKSEWIKFWSVRSTWITLVVGVLLLVGFGLLASSMFGDGSDPGGPPGNEPTDPVSASLTGTNFAMLAFGTLGVLLMAGEYGTGMIRSSLTAVPKRLPVLWAKIAVFSAVVFTVALAGAAVVFTAGQAIIGDGGASWSDPGVARAVIGTAVVLTGSGLLGIGLGALMRSTPGAITTHFGVMFLLSGIAALLIPESWSDVVQYLPQSAASAFTEVTQQEGDLSPWAGLTVFAGYVAALLGAAAWRLKRSDV